MTVAEASAAWLREQEHRVAFGDLRQRTLDIKLADFRWFLKA